MAALKRPTKKVMGVREIAEYCGIKPPNVRSMLARHGVEPYEELAVGPVYHPDVIYELQRTRLAEERLRAGDAKRRAAMARRS